GIALRNAEAERLQSCADTRERAVMIRALNVDGSLESASPLIEMIGHIRNEIRVAAVRLADHPILVVAEVGRTEPQGAIALVRLTARNQPLDGSIEAAVRVELRFEGVHVEFEAELLQVSILLAPQVGDRELSNRLEVIERAVSCEEVSCDVLDVFAGVSVLRPSRFARSESPRAGLHGESQILNLRAGVVVVVLPRYRVALRLEQRGDRIAQCGLAAMSDVQGSGRIGRDELDHHALARASGAPTIALAELVNRRKLASIGARRQEEID